MSQARRVAPWLFQTMQFPETQVIHDPGKTDETPHQINSGNPGNGAMPRNIRTGQKIGWIAVGLRPAQ
jgi:hypothetical protein